MFTNVTKLSKNEKGINFGRNDIYLKCDWHGMVGKLFDCVFTWLTKLKTFS